MCLYLKVILSVIIILVIFFLGGCVVSNLINYNEYIIKPEQYENVQLSQLHQKYLPQIEKIATFSCINYQTYPVQDELYHPSDGIRFISGPNGVYLKIPCRDKKYFTATNDSLMLFELAGYTFNNRFAWVMLWAQYFSETDTFDGLLFSIDVYCLTQQKMDSIDIIIANAPKQRDYIPRMTNEGALEYQTRKNLSEMILGSPQAPKYDPKQAQLILNSRMISLEFYIPLKYCVNYGQPATANLDKHQLWKPSDLGPGAKKILKDNTQLYINGKEFYLK